MGVIEIVIIVIAAAVVLAVAGFAVWRKVKGKNGGCCGNCSACSSCSTKAHQRKKSAAKKQTK